MVGVPHDMEGTTSDASTSSTSSTSDALLLSQSGAAPLGSWGVCSKKQRLQQLQPSEQVLQPHLGSQYGQPFDVCYNFGQRAVKGGQKSGANAVCVNQPGVLTKKTVDPVKAVVKRGPRGLRAVAPAPARATATASKSSCSNLGSACFQTTCDKHLGRLYVTLFTSPGDTKGVRLVCPRGTSIDLAQQLKKWFMSGVLQCPENPEEICGEVLGCGPCKGGYCMGGKCYCYMDHTGKGCSTSLVPKL
jgi:hypothetical protein